MHEDLYPSAHDDRTGPQASNFKGIGLLPCAIMSCARRLDTDLTGITDPYVAYRWFVSVADLFRAIAFALKRPLLAPTSGTGNKSGLKRVTGHE